VLPPPIESAQYTSSEYRQLCERLGVRQSMGRTGVCWDNAVAESFFATLKTELIYTRPWPTKAKTRLAITEWIEAHYNRRRMHSSIGYNTPLEQEQIYWNQTAKTAA
jgi:putative transposase